MKINDYAQGRGDFLFYTAKFRAVLEDHFSIFKNHPDTQYLTIEPGAAHRFEYDFYGLLTNINIDRKYHWIILRLLGFTSPMEVTAELRVIMIPSNAFVETIKNQYLTLQ